MEKTNPNEISVELAGTVSNLNPWMTTSSEGRLPMFCAHMKQAIVLMNPTIKRNQTGVERELAKYTFNRKFDTNSTILRVIPKYRNVVGGVGAPPGTVRDNGEFIVIYEDFDTKEVKHLEVKRNFIESTKLGWPFKINQEILAKMVPGETVAAGSVISQSPSVDAMGNYNYGVETEVAYLSLPGIIEDGFIVADEYLDELTTRMAMTRQGTIGKDAIPLNMYGDSENYKPFPVIGDRIRDDGIVLATRRIDKYTAMAELLPENLQADSVNLGYDRIIRGEPGALVTDVTVLRDLSRAHNSLPKEITAVPDAYSDQLLRYYEQITDFYGELRRSPGGGNIDEYLHSLIVHAQKTQGTEPGRKGQRVRPIRNIGKNPMEEYHIEITYEFVKRPNIGFKLTDGHGTKGIICKTVPLAKMPVDQNGVRVKVIKDPLAVIKRGNIGQLYEQYVNAYGFQVTQEIIAEHDLDRAFQTLLTHYKTSSPLFAEKVERLLATKAERDRHVESVRKNGIYRYLPTNSPNIGLGQYRETEAVKPLKQAPVTYITDEGEHVTTHSDVIVGSNYKILLDRTADDFSAVTFAKRQVHGVVAKLGKSDKHSKAFSNNPLRAMSESDKRWAVANIDREVMFELCKYTSSVPLSKMQNRAILNSKTPMDGKRMVPKSTVKAAKGRPLELIEHILSCGGVRLRRGIFRS